MIVAEMGVVLGDKGRQVITVSMAEDMPRKVFEWCAAHGLADRARLKIEAELRTRLDGALAAAYAEADAAEADAARPPASPSASLPPC